MSVSLPVPCLHRVHAGEPDGSLRIHQSLGMSIELTRLVERLEGLERKACRMGCPPWSVLVTFDDGWVDPITLVPQFAEWQHLQPVLFLTLSQMAGDRSLLPLPRLYKWCASSGMSLEELRSRGVTRKRLKVLPEKEQHARLDRLGVPRISFSPQSLSIETVRELLQTGWLVGSHGHDHHDLRFDKPEVLLRGLGKALEALESLGGKPWLAWPEGRCTVETCEIARMAGFKQQFSLRAEAGAIDLVDLIHRDTWK